MIETRGLIASIEAADAMVKAADVTLLRQEKADAALVTIVVEGDVSAVFAAVEAGREAANRFGTVISHLVIPHPDIETKALIQGANKTIEDIEGHKEKSDGETEGNKAEGTEETKPT